MELFVTCIYDWPLGWLKDDTMQMGKQVAVIISHLSKWCLSRGLREYFLSSVIEMSEGVRVFFKR